MTGSLQNLKKNFYFYKRSSTLKINLEEAHEKADVKEYAIDEAQKKSSIILRK